MWGWRGCVAIIVCHQYCTIMKGGPCHHYPGSGRGILLMASCGDEGVIVAIVVACESSVCNASCLSCESTICILSWLELRVECLHCKSSIWVVSWPFALQVEHLCYKCKNIQKHQNTPKDDEKPIKVQPQGTDTADLEIKLYKSVNRGSMRAHLSECSLNMKQSLHTILCNHIELTAALRTLQQLTHWWPNHMTTTCMMDEKTTAPTPPPLHVKNSTHPLLYHCLLSRPILHWAYLSGGQGVRAQSSGKTERDYVVMSHFPKGRKADWGLR